MLGNMEGKLGAQRSDRGKKPGVVQSSTMRPMTDEERRAFFHFDREYVSTDFISSTISLVNGLIELIKPPLFGCL